MGPIKIFLLYFIIFFGGCWATFFLQEYFGIGVVLASALVGLAGTIIPFPQKNKNSYQAIIYTASFAGMSSFELVENIFHIALVSIFGALIFIGLKNYFIGLGGKMGFTAFLSIIAFSLLKVVL